MKLSSFCKLRCARGLSTSVRQGFGSFHSEDIEDLILRPLAQTELSKTLSARVEETVTSWQSISSMKNEEVKELFLIDHDGFNFINHGAFGGSLYLLMFEAMKWKFHCEKQPLRFYDRELFTEIAYSLQQMAKFINCPPAELMPLQNVTSGLNCVINSTAPQIGPGDNVVCLSLTYGSTKKMLKDLCARTGASLTIVPLNLPVQGNAQVVQMISQSLNRDTKLVVIDHITSNTAMVLPILDIGAACRQLAPSAMVVMDAAHSLMSQPVSIYPPADSFETNPRSISSVADVWLTNGHKWLSAPKGCAFMWLSPSMKDKIRPSIISHGFHSSEAGGVYSAPDKVLSAFGWDGCRDYSSLLCTPSALKIWNGMPPLDYTKSGGGSGGSISGNLKGLAGCRAYMRSILVQAVSILMREWQLEEADFAAPLDMRRSSPMALVRLFLHTLSFDSK